MNPSSLVERYHQAIEAARHGDIEAAIKQLLSLAKDPRAAQMRASTYDTLACCYRWQGNLLEAEKMIRKAMQEPGERERASSWIHLGCTLILIGRRDDEVKRVLDNALDLLKNEEKIDVKVESWIDLGSIYFLGDWLEEAERCLRFAMSKTEDIDVFVAKTDIDACRLFLGGVYLKRRRDLAELGISPQWIIEKAKGYRRLWCAEAVEAIERLARQLMEGD